MKAKVSIKKIEELIPVMSNYNLQELKEEVTKILDDPNSDIEPRKAEEYKNAMNEIYTPSLMHALVSNIYMNSF